MSDNGIIEIELTTIGGDKHAFKASESLDWSTIAAGTKSILFMHFGSPLIVIIDHACRENGVAFNIPNAQGPLLHYDAEHISEIYTEVNE